MSINVWSCCQSSCLPEQHCQDCFLLVSWFWGWQGPISMTCTILRWACSWWPRTVLVYTCHSDMIISGRDSMGSQTCLGLDVKLCVTQTLLSISKPLLIISRAHLFLSIPTNALLNQDHFNSCIQPHQFPVPHHRILTFQLVKLSQLSLK